MGLLINIDNGGTFTDFCVYDGTGVDHVKTPTTPHDLTRCFVDGLRALSHRLYGEEDLGRMLRTTDYVRYSTTSGTNAIVELTGTPVGLLIGAEAGDDVYGVHDRIDARLWDAMVPGKPAHIRLDADGEVDETELIAAVNDLLGAGVGRIVIALPTASGEQAVKGMLVERYPRHLLGAVPFTLSHELVSDDSDDARRTITTVINSYLHPGLEHFLYGAQSAVASNGLDSPLLIFRNDGNSARVAKTSAVSTWSSGPRAGLDGARAYAQLYDTTNLITMDIGGTTTDASVLRGHEIARHSYGKLDSADVSIPLPEMSSVGLGGSSVVTVEDGQIQIGPRSVGAAPGPACFARGGTEATLTDALAVMGAFDPANYLDGSLALDVDRARSTIEARICKPLGLDVEQAAEAVVMAFAEREAAFLGRLLEESGADPAGTTLLAFGGGGPTIAASIANAVGITRVIVPGLAAVFSSLGVGMSSIAHEYVRRSGESADLADAMLERARRDLFGEGLDPNEASYEFALRDDTGRLLAEEEIPADRLPSGPHMKIRLRARAPLPTIHLLPDSTSDGPEATAVGQTTMSGAPLSVFDPALLQPGDRIVGPALVRGAYLTMLINSGWHLRVSANRDFLMEDNS